jgi:hypothetical protein
MMLQSVFLYSFVSDESSALLMGILGIECVDTGEMYTCHVIQLFSINIQHMLTELFLIIKLDELDHNS